MTPTFAEWGDPARRHGLSSPVRAWLAREVGLGQASRPVPLDSIEVPPSALPAEVRSQLDGVVGSEHVRDDPAERARHAAGSSYLDLLALRRGDVGSAPDAVVTPADAGEVAGVLRVCADAGVAVVPYGGGTSVVGGVRPDRGGRAAVVTLDLRRLDRLLSVDPVSRTAVFQPGVRGPAADALLAGHGLVLGHYPQSYERATLGGYAATRSAGQASTGYGRFDDLVVGLVLSTPAGELRLGRGAATAAGPSLLGLVLGSEGTYGVVTEVTVRVRPLPAVRRHEGVFFRSWAEGLDALRALEQEGVAPDVARLSDPDETRVSMVLAGSGGLRGRAGRAVLRARGYGTGCLAILGWDGTQEQVRSRRRAAHKVLDRHGAMSVGTGVGDRWAAGRFDGPYLRDDLLDAGVLVETLETSAHWSRLDEVRDAVRTALAGALAATPPTVMCHVSHLYPHGASLYVTVLARQSETDPVGQWQRAKTAATRALLDAGATLTHHHAVGADHRHWMPDEVGDLGVEVLRAVKQVLDPSGVLNPGTLLPDVLGNETGVPSR
jgi:alkyldihydroxyacetonephosphate synthase